MCRYWDSLRYHLSIGNFPKEMLPFCQFIRTRSYAIVHHNISIITTVKALLTISTCEPRYDKKCDAVYEIVKKNVNKSCGEDEFIDKIHVLSYNPTA